MNITTLQRTTASAEQLLLDDHVKEEARSLIADTRDRKTVKAVLTLDDGESIELPEDLTTLLVKVTQLITQGDLSLRAIPDELTTSTAAMLLGVSRPTLMKLILSGELPSTKVGSHHRLRAEDVYAVKAKREQTRRAAFNELLELDRQLEDLEE